MTIDLEYEYVTDTFLFNNCYIESKYFYFSIAVYKEALAQGRQMVNSSRSHRTGHFMIIQDNLTRFHLSYLFNCEPYPTPFGRVLV